MLNRKEDAVTWWAKRTTMGGWDEERYMAAFWIASVFDVYLRGNSINVTTWEALVNAGLVTEKPDRDLDDDRVNVTTEDLMSILRFAASVVPNRQEALYLMAKFSRQDLSDFGACAHYAELARSKGPFNDTTLFANVNMYKYGVLDELCVCTFYVPEKFEVGRNACKALIKLLESEGITEEVGREDLRGMLKVTRANLVAHIGMARSAEEAAKAAAKEAATPSSSEDDY